MRALYLCGFLACVMPGRAAAQAFVGPPEFDLRVTNVSLYPSASVKEGTTMTVRCEWLAQPWALVEVRKPVWFTISAWHRGPDGVRQTLQTTKHTVGKGEYAGPGYKGDAFTDALPAGELTANWTASGVGQHQLGCALEPGPDMLEGKGNPKIATNENNNVKGASFQVIGTLKEGSWPDDPAKVGLFILSPQRGAPIARPVYLHVRRSTGKSMSKPAKGVDLEWESLAAGSLWLPAQIMPFAPWTTSNGSISEAVAYVANIHPGQWRVRAKVAGNTTDWVVFTVK